MNPEDTPRCERECTRLCNDFAWTVDRCDYDAFVRLFAEDGMFERAGQASIGHAAIRRFLDGRPAGRTTRHICTNVRIDMTGPGTATGTCSALMFQAPAIDGAARPEPLPVSAPVIVDYADDYVLTDSGWKFKRRVTTLVFQP
ncbi:nuclear transport factor 2 family protein [Variovorax sp. KK3]|uniref:nuclear transport factor 2 family protein n=1 Tax=Variovorax sp. KK3 TaxID=1855728 RepID=UPI00097C0B0D|nr:nuclear transport factor 2 family protein [Variovorax sp. KK3]